VTLEGRIRELGLHEVCQLVGLGRKTGTLEIRAPLQDAAASVAFVQGAIVNASIWSAGELKQDAARSATTATDAAAIAARVLDLLTWTDGEFRFLAGTPSAGSSGLRVAIEPLLVEAAQRAALWERVADRIPSARAVPAFVDVESEQLPLLRLAPQEWEILTRVDGRRDLVELARALGRDVVDVAGLVHGLIGHGVLTLRDGVQTRRRHATPPSSAAIPEPIVVDPWVPENDAGTPTGQVEALCERGDEAARRGDLEAAVECWTAALQQHGPPSDTRSGVDVGRIREAIALAGRLHALLQPSCDALSN
jgi:hypothetical protein